MALFNFGKKKDTPCCGGEGQNEIKGTCVLDIGDTMKKTVVLLLIAVLSLSVLAGCGEKPSTSMGENPQTSTTDTVNGTDEPEQTAWKDSITENSKSEKYTLLFINDGKTENAQSIKDSMKSLAEKTSDQFVFVEVDYTKSKNSVLEYLKAPELSQLPLTLSIAPSGLICGGFDKECTEDELKSTITTGTKEEILLALQKGEITLITIHNGKNDEISELDKTILKEAEPYNGCVVSYYLDSTNEEDAKFIANLPETKGDITFMVIVSPGSIVATLTDDEITAESIAAAIKQASEGGGCGCS